MLVCWVVGLEQYSSQGQKERKKKEVRSGQVRPGQVSYLLLNILERVRRVDGKADQDNMRVGVGQRAETVIVLLAYLQYKIKMSVNLVVDWWNCGIVVVYRIVSYCIVSVSH